MDVVKDSSRIDYSIRLFYEDFQALINSKYNTLLDFKKENRISLKEQQYILEYLNSSFILFFNSQIPVKPVFLGWKVENMSVWFYFGMNFNSSIQKLIIENKLMSSLYTDQKNLLILNHGGKEEGFEFNQRNTRFEVLLF
jgi:hypothetical protein